jgi:uncharacterized repeat protein (TIGR02543 family)
MLSKKLALPTAIGFGFASTLAAINPSHAALVPGCGEADPGVSLTNRGEYCEAVFSNAGAQQFTLPPGISDLYGIVVAGGGGTYLYNYDIGGIYQRYAIGYAGDGGGAEAFQWSDLPANARIEVQVGAAGTNSTAIFGGNANDGNGTAGENSSVSISNSAFALISTGGQIGSDRGNCAFPSAWASNEEPYLALARGKSGTGVVPVLNDLNANETCAAASGLNPASINAIPIFKNAVADYARGGTVYSSAPAANELQRGEGASIVINTSTRLLSASPAQPGIVILRYASFAVPLAITFDGNGATSGTVPVDSTTYRLGSTTNVWPKPRNLIREGYTFTGWNTAANGSGTRYAVGAPLTITGDIKLYAQWEKIFVAQVNRKRIATFGGDSATLSTAMRSQISAWVRSLPQDAKIVCTGSTSGRNVTAFDTRLARTRAVNVCNYALQIRPNLTFKIDVRPSSSTAVSARNVWMSLGF